MKKSKIVLNSQNHFFSKIFHFRGKQTNYQNNFLDPKSMEHLLKNEPYSVNFGQKLTELRSKTKTTIYE